MLAAGGAFFHIIAFSGFTAFCVIAHRAGRIVLT